MFRRFFHVNVCNLLSEIGYCPKTELTVCGMVDCKRNQQGERQQHEQVRQVSWRRLEFMHGANLRLRHDAESKIRNENPDNICA
jgi:hypothetical protein